MTERKFTDEKVALLKTEIFCHWQNDLSCYLIVLISTIDDRIDVAKYDPFLFKVAVGFVDLIAQLLVLPFRKHGFCCSQHCGNTSEAEFKVNFGFDSVCMHQLISIPKSSVSNCSGSYSRNSYSDITSPVKFGDVSSVKEIYPCSPKSIGSLVTTEPA